MSNSYAEIYAEDASTAQALTSTAAKITGFATAGRTSSDQGDQKVVGDVANDKITVDPGSYLVSCSLSLSQDDGSANQLEVAIRAAGSEVAGGHAEKQLGASGVSDSVHLQCIVEVSAESDIEIYGELQTADANITITQANLSVISLD